MRIATVRRLIERIAERMMLRQIGELSVVHDHRALVLSLPLRLGHPAPPSCARPRSAPNLAYTRKDAAYTATSGLHRLFTYGVAVSVQFFESGFVANAALKWAARQFAR